MAFKSFASVSSFAILASGVLFAAQAQAQVSAQAPVGDAAAAAPGTEEIIVTAQKRSENLQSVPLAVTAVTAGAIQSRGLANIAQLSQLAPNVNLSEGIVNPTVIVPFIRGIGSVDNSPEIDLPVAVSIDGVYLASAYGGLIDAFDIQQVEILRGPQGTLQGRNAPAGAVNITTRRPGDKLTERALVQYGNFNDLRVNADIDGPITDAIGFKLAILRRKSDGYVHNDATGHDFGGRNTWAFHGGLSIHPDSRLKVWLAADYTRDTSEPTGFRSVNDGRSYPRPETDAQTNTYACILFGDCTPTARYKTNQTFYGNAFVTNIGLVSNIDYDLGPASLTSITGYRKVRDTYRLDIDATPFDIIQSDPTTLRQKTFSQEMRIASNDGSALTLDNHIRWLIGAYYMHHRFSRYQNVLVFDNRVANNNYGQLLKSYALFGHLDVMPIDKLTLSVGVRQMWDNKDFQNFESGVVGTQKFQKFVFDANAEYKFTRDIMAYARFARGYRPGGFNTNGIQFAPENVDSYEGGLKTQFFDRRLTFNLTGFYYKYTNLQRQSDVSFLDAAGNQAFVRATSNVGAQHAEGVELELSGRPTSQLNLNFSLGYLKAKYDKFTVSNGGVLVDDSALPVFEAPKWTIGGGASYTIPVDNSFIGDVIPSINAYYKSGLYTQAAAQPVSYVKGYVLLNGAIKFRDPSKRFAFSVFADNMLNSYYFNSGGTLGGLSNYVQDAPPRTYGVRFEVEF